MKKMYHQIIANDLDEDRNIVRTTTHESIILVPGEGKKLKHIKKRYIIKGAVCLGSKESPEDYEEID